MIPLCKSDRMCSRPGACCTARLDRVCRIIAREGRLGGATVLSPKHLMGLAPLLAILAFAGTPVTAQAAQHWYKNNVKLAEGKPIPVVTFGGAVNFSSRSEVGELNCRTVGAGTIENPVGGGAGVGKTYESTFFACKAPACEEAGAEDKIPLELFLKTNAEEYGWTDELEEAAGSPATTREKIGEPFSGTFHPYGSPSPTHEIMWLATCETPPGFEPYTAGVACTFEGELTPEIGAAETNLDGTKAAVPSTAKFDGASTGALHSEIAGEGTDEGSIKYLGYTAQEVITVRE